MVEERAGASLRSSARTSTYDSGDASSPRRTRARSPVLQSERRSRVTRWPIRSKRPSRFVDGVAALGPRAVRSGSSDPGGEIPQPARRGCPADPSDTREAALRDRCDLRQRPPFVSQLDELLPRGREPVQQVERRRTNGSPNTDGRCEEAGGISSMRGRGGYAGPFQSTGSFRRLSDGRTSRG